MGIFFNEFNRYRTKSDKGQIFTPDHITSLMYRLINCSMTDRILDATCGSGAFIVKAMCNMIKESGGVGSKEADEIKSSQLFGIEVDREIFALACANMLIHKDGKTNLAQLDTSTQTACDWIKEKQITKVLMNPPYERKYKCMTIVENVLNNVPKGTVCAFILPDKKLEKDGANRTYGNRLLKKHYLTTIIKLPENLFFKVGVTTSIFIFIAGTPQNNRNVIGYYIEDDGLETVKNQGRQDIRNRWQQIENYWVQAIHDGVDNRFNTRQIITPGPNSLSYKMPTKPFEIFEEDFAKVALDYIMAEQQIDVTDLEQMLLHNALYSSAISQEDGGFSIKINSNNK